MVIKNPENIVFGCFYWLEYLGTERIGQALDFYGEVRFFVTGLSDTVEFSEVQNIHAVCLVKH